MAYDNPDSELYGGDTQASAEGAPVADKPMEENESPSATIPKSLLMGKDFKPGDEIVLRIDKIMGDEVLVSYSTEKAEPEMGEAPMPEGNDMAGMME